MWYLKYNYYMRYHIMYIYCKYFTLSVANENIIELISLHDAYRMLSVTLLSHIYRL